MWTQVTADLSSLAGRTVVLWFETNDGRGGNLTSMGLDDVAGPNLA